MHCKRISYLYVGLDIVYIVLYNAVFRDCETYGPFQPMGYIFNKYVYKSKQLKKIGDIQTVSSFGCWFDVVALNGGIAA